MDYKLGTLLYGLNNIEVFDEISLPRVDTNVRVFPSKTKAG